MKPGRYEQVSKLSRPHVLLALLVLLTACQTEPGKAPGSSEPPPVPAARPDHAPAAPVALAAPGEPAPSSRPLADRGLTLEEAVRIAKERSPDLAVARKGLDVQAAALEVTRTYPFNPQLSADVRPYVRERGGKRDDLKLDAAILQEFELARQGRHRERTGEAELERAVWSTRAREVQVAAETERRFFAAVYWRERRDLEESLRLLRDDLRGVTERRFEAGLSTASDVALARIEAQSARQQVELAQMRRDSALSDLRKLLAMPPEAQLEPSGSLLELEWIPVNGNAAGAPRQEVKPGLSAGVEALVAARPDVKAVEAARDAASARVDLASAERIPNVTLGPAYERDEAGTSFFGLQFQIPIPVLSTGGPIVRQRRAELEESLESLRQLRLKAGTELEAAVKRYDLALRLASRFRGDLVEGLEREIQRVMSQYEAGIASLLEAYAARDKMMQARQSSLDVHYELALSAADLTEAAALPYETLLRPPVPLNGTNLPRESKQP